MGLKGDMFYSGFWPTAVINDKNVSLLNTLGCALELIQNSLQPGT